MLDLDPDTRITAEEALEHDYLKQYSDPSDEPSSDSYDQSFEDQKLEIEEWKSECFSLKKCFAFFFDNWKFTCILMQMILIW